MPTGGLHRAQLHQDGDGVLSAGQRAEIATVKFHRLLRGKAEAFAERIGLSYDHILGVRFAVNVFIAGTIVWFALRHLGSTSFAWAIASMIATSDPQPEKSRQFFNGRLINVLVGCFVGFCWLLAGARSEWIVPSALAVTVLISSCLIRVQAMSRQAPITAAIVIAAGLTGGSTQAGMTLGEHKVIEVLFGSIVGAFVSWASSKLWLIREPSQRDGSA